MMKTSHNPSKGKHWVCNDDLKLSICIEPNALYWEYLATGWHTGRCYSEQALKNISKSSSGRIWIHKKDLSKQFMVDKKNITSYMETGEWEYGMLPNKKRKISTKRKDKLLNKIANNGSFNYQTNNFYKGVVNRGQVRRYLLYTGNHLCANCGKTNVKLIVHAKDGNCKNLSVDNYDFLCRECYLKSGNNHTQYGTVWLFNEELKQNKLVRKEIANSFLELGWRIGRKMSFQ